jgi:hypothetical protein
MLPSTGFLCTRRAVERASTDLRQLRWRYPDQAEGAWACGIYSHYFAKRGVAGAGRGAAGAEEDVEEHQDTNIACVVGIDRYRAEDGSSARCRVGQLRSRTKQRGTSGGGLHTLHTTQARGHTGPARVN